MDAAEALEALDRDIARHEKRIAESWRGTEKTRLEWKIEGMRLARTYLAGAYEDRPMDTDPTVVMHNAGVNLRRGFW